MNGGYFENRNLEFDDIADEIEKICKDNNHGFCLGTLYKLNRASYKIREAGLMCKIVDLLISGYNSEELFNELWNKKIRKDDI